MKGLLHPPRAAIIIRALALVALILLALTSCALGGPTHAQARPRTTATVPDSLATQPPVAVLVMARQRSGSAAKHNVVLRIDVDIINYTKQPIRLAGTCIDPFISLGAIAPDDPAHPISLDGSPNCVLQNPAVWPREGIAPNTAYQWADWNLQLFTYSRKWQAGRDYTLTVAARAWFQGALDRPVIAGTAQGRDSFILR
jgi:hypothetical protein